jgi:hypothetical protein
LSKRFEIWSNRVISAKRSEQMRAGAWSPLLGTRARRKHGLLSKRLVEGENNDPPLSDLYQLYDGHS